MSTVRCDNFGPSAGGTTYSARGIAKAWVNFNGTGTIAARDSENVSSLTDNGAGNYTINYSSAFSATDYAALGTNTEVSGVTSGIFGFDDTHVYSTSATEIINYNQSGYSFADTTRVNFLVMGDLA